MTHVRVRCGPTDPTSTDDEHQLEVGVNECIDVSDVNHAIAFDPTTMADRFATCLSQRFFSVSLAS